MMQRHKKLQGKDQGWTHSCSHAGSMAMTDLFNFYDPHPGLAGCTIPIPEPVRLVANQLEKDPPMLIEEAMQKIQDASPSGEVTAIGPDDFSSDGFVSLKLGELPSPQHSWRVIRFVKDEV